jgi:endoglucanase
VNEILQKLLTVYGPSGHENKAAAVATELVRPYVDEIETDALNNLIAIKRGTSGKRVMLAAHLDQIGYVVTSVCEKGFLRVARVGGVPRANSLYRQVAFENGVVGVVATELQDVDASDATLQKLFIDIGAANREEALSMVSIGDMAVWLPSVHEHKSRVSSPAMDNRAGCALMIMALKYLSECPHDIYAVFTAQEEVGLRGSTVAAYDINPDVGIALDVTSVGDTPKGTRNNSVALGEGIAVKILDQAVVCTPWVVDQLEAAGDKCGVKHQREVLEHGGTDAGAIQKTHVGVPAGVLSIPCRYVHSAAEMIDLNDLEAGARLLAAFLSDLAL